MNVYTVEYATPKDPPLRERRLKADDYTVHGDFVDFTTADGKKVFSVHVEAVVTISREAAAT
ncbi:hypothetical protein [Streptomyces sp. NBC_00572]|uniref:hypothetical protein n=1 Tax=Streptomyces sp. NBC_00572 TaxID=2903664 RepID=UPI002257DC83|nr:hypothetical protein [Streptomyces sp. NBC_00572]MCX4986010.1 hypothetical protein [Streptomyces sp. NBC_00572]